MTNNSSNERWVVDDLQIKGTASSSTPTITTSATTLAVGSTNAGTPSSPAVSYNVSGANLTADLVITAPTNFEVSTSSSSGFGSSVNLTPSSGTVASTPIYVRLSGTGSGTVSGNVTNASTGATTLNVAASGTVQAPAISTAGTFTAFNALAGAPSAAQSYTVSGSNLSADITVTAPTGYEVSLVAASGYASSVVVPQSGGSASSTVYVRLIGSGSGAVSGNLLHQSTGAADVTKAVTGTVVPEPTTQPSVSTGTVGVATAVLNVTGGNGSSRLLVIRQTSTGAVVPTDQVTYTANTAFGNSGTGTTTGTGNYVIIAGTATSVTVTGLTASTGYTAEVYAYNEGSAAGFENYLTTSPGSVAFTTTAGSPIVISQVYSAGGNSGATYNSDYVEVFNRSAASVSLSGYSIAYFSSGGSAGGTVALSGSLGAGKYYLVQLSGGSNGVALPTPDATGTIAMSASAGRVDLLSGSTLMDRVGYGAAASPFEGSGPAPAPSTTNAIFRASGGCTDTNDNAADFTAAAAGPRNTATAANPCGPLPPALTANPTTLNLTAQVGQTASGSYTLTGVSLGSGGTVSISSGDASVLVSVNSSPFATTATATADASGALSQVVNVQYTAPGVTGTAAITIANTITVGGTPLSAPVTVNTTATPAPAAEPTTQPTVSVSNVTYNTADITVTGGDGASRLVVIRPTSATAVAPADGTAYTANAAYGSGATTGTNNYVVLAGTSTTVTVTGLAQLTGYSVEVYAYNGSGTTANYLTTAPGTASFTTTVAPAMTWDGGGDGVSFSDAQNWVGDVVPATGDAILFDHSVVTTAYSVNLPSGSPAQLSLASLIINPNGGSAITVTLPTTNTTTDYLRLTRSTMALVIYDGGTFINSSGASTGTPVDVTTGTENFIIYNGGSFVHQCNRSISALVDNLATTLPGTETGRFVYNVAGSSFSPALSGRTYGSLVLRTTSASLTYIGSGSSPLTIRGNLDIDTNITFAPTLNADISVGGNLINNGRFRFEPASLTTRRFLILNGTTPQTISGSALTVGTTGTSYLGDNVALRINNPAGVTLATPVAINAGASATARGGLDLVAGTITTSSSALLTLATNATILNTPGTGSFVNGPLARTMASGSTGSVLFPLGKNAAYRPLTLNLTTLANATTFTAEQREGRPTAGTPLSGGLMRVSQVRQFTVTPAPVPAAGEFEGTITLSFGADDQVTDPADATLVIAKNSSSNWENIGRTTNTGTANGGYVDGTLTSAAFTSFSDFALASTDALNAANPLPVTLTSFSARRQNGDAARLQWTTAQEKNNARFEVLRSTTGQEFRVVGTVAGAGNSTSARSYSFTDKQVPATAVYYRLRQIDHDGTSTLSDVVTLSKTDMPRLVALYPNPAHQQLYVATAAEQVRWSIVDVLGRTWLQGRSRSTEAIDVSKLPAGAYQVLLTTDGQTTKLPLLKVE